MAIATKYVVFCKVDLINVNDFANKHCKVFSGKIILTHYIHL